MNNVLEKITESEFRLPPSPKPFYFPYIGKIVWLTEEQIQKRQEDFHKWWSEIGIRQESPQISIDEFCSTQVTAF